MQSILQKDIKDSMQLFRTLAIFISLTCLVFIPSFAAPNSYPGSTFPITGTSRTPAMDAFDKKFIALVKKWHLQGGAALVVMKNGQIIAERGYGWADAARNEQVQPDSLFRIASASKTFTAVTVLKLVQQHKLNLDDKVFYILNDLKPLEGRRINQGIYQITIKNLLQMSSGWFLPGGGHFDPLFGPWTPAMRTLLNPELPASCETTTRYMMSMPLRRKPGAAFVYSNLDYCILGLVINKVTGSKYSYLGYQNYVKSQILSPLHITDMAVGSTQLKYRLPKEVHYYRDIKSSGAEELANSFYLPYSPTEILRKNFGNGGWVASAVDLATFIQAVNNGEVLDTTTLDIMRSRPAYLGTGVAGAASSKKTKQAKSKGKTKTATAPTAGNSGRYYSMGGIIYTVGGQRYWVQTGSFTGTNALVVTKPDGTTIAVIFNTRPNISGFLSRFRPELRVLLMTSNI
jgi:CubicO group peptidase (beta-lactamase class C family)